MKKFALPFASILAVMAMPIAGCGGAKDTDRTALCKDGRYSYETDCSKICEGRGGVETWYVNCEGSSIGLAPGK